MNRPQSSAQREALEQYIGIRHAFPDPYHLYLHKNDLGINGEGSPVVRFIVYSMGKKKIVMIGFYRRYGDKSMAFKVTYACKYSMRELMDLVQEWSPRFINTLNIMKNRIQGRIDKFLNVAPDPLIATKEDYKQLKIWLSTQPLSEYYMENKEKGDMEYRRSLISQEYMEKLYTNIPQMSIIDNLKNEYVVSSLSGDKGRISEDINELYVFIMDKLDKLIAKYEQNLNILSMQNSNKEIVRISQAFYEWISSSMYSSESWYNTLDLCSCKNIDDPGCHIISFGEDESLV